MDNKALINLYLGDYTASPMASIKKRLEDSYYFSDTESGLYNPHNSSIIKIKDNGMIDAFVNTNQGIRIDPKTKSINMFTNNENHTVSNLSIWAEKEVRLNIKRKLSITAKDGFIKTKDLQIECTKYQMTTHEFKTSAEEFVTDSYIHSDKAYNYEIESELYNLQTSRDKITLGSKTMSQMDDEISDINSDIDIIRDELFGIHENIISLSNDSSDIRNMVNERGDSLTTLWNKVSVLEEYVNNQIPNINRNIQTLFDIIDIINS